MPHHCHRLEQRLLSLAAPFLHRDRNQLVAHPVQRLADDSPQARHHDIPAILEQLRAAARVDVPGIRVGVEV